MDEGDRSAVETCARSCAPWSIRLHCPFKPPPGSPALLLGLASSGVCGFIWQRCSRQSAFHSLLRNAQLSPEASAGSGEYRLSLLMLRRWLITPCVSAGRAVLKTWRHPFKKKNKIKHLLNLTRRQHRCCTVGRQCLICWWGANIHTRTLFSPWTNTFSPSCRHTQLIPCHISLIMHICMAPMATL